VGLVEWVGWRKAKEALIQSVDMSRKKKGTLRNLFLHRIFSKFEGKMFFFKWKSKW
jgi:hypothetical protein